MANTVHLEQAAGEDEQPKCDEMEGEQDRGHAPGQAIVIQQAVALVGTIEGRRRRQQNPMVQAVDKVIGSCPVPEAHQGPWSGGTRPRRPSGCLRNHLPFSAAKMKRL